jgi:hypothetical protein
MDLRFSWWWVSRCESQPGHQPFCCGCSFLSFIPLANIKYSGLIMLWFLPSKSFPIHQYLKNYLTTYCYTVWYTAGILKNKKCSSGTRHHTVWHVLLTVLQNASAYLLYYTAKHLRTSWYSNRLLWSCKTHRQHKAVTYSKHLYFLI